MSAREEPWCTTGVDEDDRFVLAPAAAADMRDQSRHGFAGINGVEDQCLGSCCQFDCGDGAGVRDAVTGAEESTVERDILRLKR